jgi:hypothetical protein
MLALLAIVTILTAARFAPRRRLSTRPHPGVESGR